MKTIYKNKATKTHSIKNLSIIFPALLLIGLLNLTSCFGGGMIEMNLAQLDVVSATSMSNTSVAITFSEPVDPTIAMIPTNYSIEGLSVTAAVVSEEDPATVILTTTEQEAITYTVTVTNVVAVSYHILSENNTAEFNGQAVCPQLTSVEATTSTNLVVSFSMPMEIEGLETQENFSIQNNAIGLNYFQAADDGMSVKITTTPQQEDTTYILIVAVENLFSQTGQGLCSEDGSEVPTEYEFMASTVEDVEGPYLESVTALNKETVQVVFSEPVMKTTAETIGNYSIPGLQIHNALISNENRTIVLLNTAEQDYKEYELTISDIQDIQGNPPTDPTSKKFNGSTEENNEPPKLLEVISLDLNTVIAIFNKPLLAASAGNEDNYNIEGLDIYSVKPNLLNTAKVTIETALQEELVYTLICENIQDLHGNPIGEENQANFSGDRSPTLHSVEADGNTRITVKFSEPVQELNAEMLENYEIDGLEILGAQREPTEPYKVTLLTSSQLQEVYALTVSSVKDYTDNWMLDPITRSFRGDGLPYIETLNADSNTRLRIWFNEEMDAETAESAVSYAIPDLDITEARLELDGKEVLLTTESQQDKEYSLNVLTAEDLTENIPAQPSETTFQGNFLPAIDSVEAVNQHHIKVTFTKPMNVYTLSHYVYSGTEQIDTPVYTLPPSILVDGWAADKDNAYIGHVYTTNPMSSVDDYDLEALRVRDSSWNVMDDTSNTMNFNGSDVDPSTSTDDIYISYATPLSTTTIEIVFNQPPDPATVIAGNFSITSGLSITDADVSPYNTCRVLLTTTPQSEIGYTVSAANITPLYGTGMQVQPYAKTFTGLEGPKLYFAEAHNSTYVEVRFNRHVYVEGYNYEEDHKDLFTIEDDAGNDLEVLSANRSLYNNNVFYLTTAEQSETRYTVSITPEVFYVTDQIGNKLDSTDNEEDFDGEGGPTVVSIEVRDPLTIVVEFSENVDQVTAENAGHYSIEGLTIHDATRSYSNKKKVYLATEAQTSGLEYTLEVNGVLDNNLNPTGTPNTGTFTGY